MLFEKLRRIKAVKVGGVLRVAAYFGVVCTAMSGYALHEAKAAVTEEGFVLGRDLARVADLLDHTYEVNLNGQQVYMANVDTLLPMKDILDRYEGMCRDNPGLLADAWKSIPKDKQKVEGKNEFSGLVAEMGIVRKSSEHEGMVACLAPSNNQAGSISEGLARFSRTGDLGYIGKLRYVYVAGPSSSGRFMVTTIWTENNFNVNHIMIPEGVDDAPGTDSPTVGRPPSSQRLFSASITGTPYGYRIYKSTATPENIFAKTDAQMTSDGWLLFATEGAPHTYFKDGVETMLFAGPDTQGSGKTVVMISELGGEGFRGSDGMVNPSRLMGR
jgi:hypothetical protein